MSEEFGPFLQWVPAESPLPKERANNRNWPEA